MDERAAYDEVYVDSLGRPGFLLQHVVDAYAVQSATPESPRISVVFGLVGLYLYVEKAFSGRGVQLVHRQLARAKREWPSVFLPEDRGVMTAFAVWQAPPGDQRDLAIRDWCRSVWLAFAVNRTMVVDLLRHEGIV